MALPLLRLIGLRHNQIEHDNCVPATFSVTRARPPREGREHVLVHMCIGLVLMCTNVYRWGLLHLHALRSCADLQMKTVYKAIDLFPLPTFASFS